MHFAPGVHAAGADPLDESINGWRPCLKARRSLNLLLPSRVRCANNGDAVAADKGSPPLGVRYLSLSQVFTAIDI